MTQEVVNNKVDHEFTTYMKPSRLDLLDHETGDFTCPLNWWKKHAKLLPTLSDLAGRYLCIPTTSAPSERAFSNASLTIANDRASLLPGHASDMIFLRMGWDLAVDWNKKRTNPLPYPNV